MDKEKKGFVTWVKEHKKKLILAGVSVGVIIAIVLGVKNKDALMKLWETMKASIKKPIAPGRDISVATPTVPAIHAMEVRELPAVEITKSSRIMQYPFDVSDHIRNLHPGWKASAEKLAEAERLGIVLQPGQTLVDGYTKGGLAA